MKEFTGFEENYSVYDFGKCEMCGQEITAQNANKHSVQGRGANFRNQYNSTTFSGWDRIVLVCDEDEA